MKSFFKFVGFILVWCIVYLIVSALFNWGTGLLGNALNLDTLIGKLILVSICSSVMWVILFYPTIIISSLLLDKRIYATLALILMILYNILSLYVFYQLGWVMIVIWIVHAFSTIFPVWTVRNHLSLKEEAEKIEKETEYRNALKAEIMQEINNGQG